jgi:hypothetical protein
LLLLPLRTCLILLIDFLITRNRESEFDRRTIGIVFVYPNHPTMIFYNAFTYNQTKSSSSVFPCQSCVYLIKCFEKIVHFFKESTPFVTLGQTIRATYNYVDPDTQKQQDISKSFVVTGIIAPTGNNQLDRAIIINAAAGDSLFLKGGKYEQMVVTANSADYVPTVQTEITSLYGTNIGITTPKAILQARERFTGGNDSFIQSVAFIALLVGNRHCNYAVQCS